MLLDVDMPGMDGFEVCRRIRQRWDGAEVPVIMITGMNDVESINRAYESGANDFITKPINWQVLGHRARYVLRASHAARELRQLEEKQAAIVRAMPDMIFLIGRNGTCLDFKDGFGSKAFVPPGGFVGRSMSVILPPGVAAVLARAVALALDRGELQSVNFQLPLDDGIRHYEARVAPNGADTVVAVVRDVTSQKRDEERIHRLAYFDTLTGMPNRGHFIERVEGELSRARREDRLLALLFLDLDGFKRINDTLGHTAGDSLLKTVAERLRHNLRAGDVMARPTARRIRPALRPARRRRVHHPAARREGHRVREARSPGARRRCWPGPSGRTTRRSPSPPASASRSFPTTARTPPRCSSMRTPRCTTPRSRAGTTGSSTTGRSPRGRWRGSAWRTTCARRSSWASSACSTSRRSSRRTAASRASRR